MARDPSRCLRVPAGSRQRPNPSLAASFRRASICPMPPMPEIGTLTAWAMADWIAAMIAPMPRARDAIDAPIPAASSGSDPLAIATIIAITIATTLAAAEQLKMQFGSRETKDADPLTEAAVEVIDDGVCRARPDALRTVLPFKKLLLRPKFSMLEQSKGGADSVSADNDRGPQVFFGAHACDIHALKILDLIYLSHYPDPYYRRNREQLTVVGFGCWRGFIDCNFILSLSL